jgi:hypothetical protein
LNALVKSAHRSRWCEIAGLHGGGNDGGQPVDIELVHCLGANKVVAGGIPATSDFNVAREDAVKGGACAAALVVLLVKER